MFPQCLKYDIKILSTELKSTYWRTNKYIYLGLIKIAIWEENNSDCLTDVLKILQNGGHIQNSKIAWYMVFTPFASC